MWVSVNTTHGAMRDVQLEHDATKKDEWKEAKDAAQHVIDALAALGEDIEQDDLMFAAFIDVDGWDSGILVFTTMNDDSIPVTRQVTFC